MITLEPLISMATWLSLLAAAVAAFVVFFLRRPAAIARRPWRGLSALTALGMALVLLLLLNPTRVERVPEAPGKPLLTLLVDSSASMATPDAEKSATRFESARRWAADLAKAAEAGFEVRVTAFDQATKTVGVDDLGEPKGPLTNLAAALQDAIADQRPQGQAAVLLSDGIHNAGDTASVVQAGRDARARGCPVMTHTFGSDREAVDLAVEVRTPQEVAFVGQPIQLSATLVQRGLKDESVSVRLSRDGQSIESRKVTLSGPSEEVRFEAPAGKVGLYRYDFEADPLTRETSRTNNTASLLVQVIDRPVRVLLLEGKPYWDGKFLARTLSADPSVELDCVIRMGEGRLHHRSIRRVRDAVATQKGEESRLDEQSRVLDDFGKFLGEDGRLNSYQVIVLGRDAESLLEDSVIQSLRTWLSDVGGSLVCFRGQPVAQVTQKLAPLLPIRWSPASESRVRWRLTDQGKDLGWLLPGESAALLPSLSTVARAESPRPLAVVWAVAEDGAAPMVTYQPYGLGRVVAIEGSGMWRWAFQPPGQKSGDQVYGTLWRNMVRWLVSSAVLLPGQEMALRGDSMTFAPNEAVSLTLLTRRDARIASPPALELHGDGDALVKTITPLASSDDASIFRVPLGRLPEGRYRLDAPGVPGVRTLFDVRASSREMLDLRARPDLMAAIARDSGGIVLDDASPGEIYGRIQEQFQRGRPGHVRRVSLWDRWWVFAAIGGVWVLTWVLRRRRNLL